MLVDGLVKRLHAEGFVCLERYEPQKTTLEVAQYVGKVIDLSVIAPNYGVGSVQPLKPKPKSLGVQHKYHGNFGFDEYPAHTDLAHWSMPPRYLLLRCIDGAQEVYTYVYHKGLVSKLLPKCLLTQAVFVPRKSDGLVVPLSMNIEICFSWSVRHDSIFLRPINDSAKECVDIIGSAAFGEKRECIALVNQGDTLIIDNWASLHGRSAVSAEYMNRQLERAYLETVYGL